MFSTERRRILFLCTGNSCRSQMAEGLLRHRHGDRFDAFSAGIATHGLNPDAVLVMQEIGIDISSHQSKTLEDLSAVEFDTVITVCDHASETCPVFTGRTTKLHRGFPDPPQLAANAASREAALDHYRNVRDQIAAFIDELPGLIG